MARLARLRHGRARRHGLPHPRSGLLGARARTSASVEATSTHYEPAVASETYPRASIVRYAFPARGNRPPVKLTWYDGRLLPPTPPELEPGRSLPGSGALLIGDKGTILHGSHGADGVRLIPETRMQEYKRPPKTLRRVTEGHEGDWIRACKEGPNGVPPCSSFEYGGALTEMVLLGVLAIRMKDQRLDWDSQNLSSPTTCRRTTCSASSTATGGRSNGARTCDSRAAPALRKSRAGSAESRCRPERGAASRRTETSSGPAAALRGPAGPDPGCRGAACRDSPAPARAAD